MTFLFSSKMLIFIAFGVAAFASFYAFVYEDFSWQQTAYRSNPILKTVRADWKGTPVNKDGRYLNENAQPLPGFGAIWKWQTTQNPQKKEKKADTFRLKVERNTAFLTSNQDGIVWLGHATFFIRINGITILTDPVLDSPSFLMKRFSDLPVSIAALTNLDYIFVSHDHRDHCDEKSLEILAKQNPKATYLTGLGLDKLLEKITKSSRIQAAGWYQQYQTDTTKIEVIYLPTRHWGRRFLNDTNVNLWGAYLIKANGKSIYFGGDSGYGSHYQDFAKYFGGVDIAILGIGAYKPEWFMSASHAGPTEALKAARELNAKRMIPMHYGTFDLSDEPIGECHRMMQQFRQKPENQSFITLPAIGEAVVL